MSNLLSRFNTDDLDFGKLDEADELYKKARPATRIQMELGRYTIRVMPGLPEDRFLSGGFPWITIWQHNFTSAGKDHVAVCPRMHSHGQQAPCPLCEEAEMGNSNMVPKRQAIANAMVLRFAPRGSKAQDVQVFEHPKVLPWNVPGGVAAKFREWVDAARLDGEPMFFDPMRGNLIDVTKSPKPNARDAKRDVQYSVDKKASCPIGDNAAVVNHILGLCLPLSGKVELYDYNTMKRWFETGERPARDLSRPLTPQAPSASRQIAAPAAPRPSTSVTVAPIADFDASPGPSDDEDIPF